MLKLIPVLIVLINFGISFGVAHTDSRHGEYVSRGTFPLAKKRATGIVATPDSTTDLLARLKLLAYEEKLKEKELKKETKAEKAKAKTARDQAMWAAYLNSVSAAGDPSSATTGTVAGTAPLPAPFLYPTVPFAAAAPAAGALPIMPMPMYPAIGLWKKQMFLSQLYGGAALAAQQQAQAQAAAAAAAATTTAPTTTQDTIVQINKRDVALAVRKEKVINQITKRYARYLRNKHAHGGKDDDEQERYKYKHGKKNRDENDDDDEEDDDEDDGLSGASNSNLDNDDEVPLSSLSGASNKFGTAPGGNSPVAQAGCSGSHIHVCSGTTFYLNSPENIKSASDLPEDLKPDDDNDEDNDKQLRKYKSYSDWKKSWRNDDDDEKDRHWKKSKKHGHRGVRKHKKHGHKKYEEDKRTKSNEDEQDQEDNENDIEDEPAATAEETDKDVNGNTNAGKDEKKA